MSGEKHLENTQKLFKMPVIVSSSHTQALHLLTKGTEDRGTNKKHFAFVLSTFLFLKQHIIIQITTQITAIYMVLDIVNSLAIIVPRRLCIQWRQINITSFI